MTPVDITPDSKQKHFLKFLSFTFAFSWLVWICVILLKPSAGYLMPLLFLGAFGPSLSAIFLIWKYGSSNEKKNFMKGLYSLKRIGLKYFALILLIFPAILFTGYFLYSFFGGDYPSFENYFGGLESFSDILTLLFIMLIGGPVSEELGWRGYALDPLQKRWGPITGSIILGVIWIFWHLPLFFIEGTSQYSKGFGIAFWSWSIQLIMISLIFTLVYNRTRQSILAAILLHLMANTAYPLNLDNTGEMVFTGLRIFIILGTALFLSKKKVNQKSSDARLIAAEG